MAGGAHSVTIKIFYIKYTLVGSTLADRTSRPQEPPSCARPTTVASSESDRDRRKADSFGFQGFFRLRKQESRGSQQRIPDLTQRSDQWPTKFGFLRIPGVLSPLKNENPRNPSIESNWQGDLGLELFGWSTVLRSGWWVRNRVGGG